MGIAICERMPEEREGSVYGVESLRMQTWMRFSAHADSDNGFSPLEDKLEGGNLKHYKKCKVFFSENNKCLFVQDAMLFLLQRIKNKAVSALSGPKSQIY